MQHNYSVVTKGIYERKQTSEFLEITRYMIVRKRHKRYLLLELNNKNTESLTALSLQIDQYDARGNSLGVINVNFDEMSIKQGEFILKEKIELHRACFDFFIKITISEYGKYRYCLGENGTYSVLREKVEKKPVSRESVKKQVGEEGHVSSRRRFTAPVLVSMVAVLIVASIVAGTILHLNKFKGDENSFFLNNVRYTFATSDKGENAPVYVSGYNGYGGGDIIISDNIEGHPVTKIGARSFEDSKRVKSVIVNNVPIEQKAFYNCSKLESVELHGVSVIGKNAFYNCDNLSNVEVHDASVIKANAFANCENLSTVLIKSENPENVLTLETGVFSECGVIGEVNVDQYIGYEESYDFFLETSSITTLKLKNYNYTPYEKYEGKTAKPISALFGETKNISLKNLEISFIDSIPANFTEGVSNDLESVKIYNMDTKTIGDKAFMDCMYLSNLEIPTVLTVGDYAFKNSAITNFEAKELTAIGNEAFYGCTGLEIFDLSENTTLTNIPKNSFKGCSSLKEIYIPKQITEMGDSAFENAGLTSLSFAKDNQIKSLPSKAFKNNVNLTSVNLSDNLEVLSNQGFQGCESLSTISFPDSVYAIDESTFAGCKSLSLVNVNEGLLSIGKMAFKGCSALRNIELPSSLLSVNSNAFENSGLEGIVIPNGVQGISESVFKGCSKLKQITVPFIGSSQAVAKNLGYLFGDNDYSTQETSIPATLKSITITKGLVVAYGAFYNCRNVKEINLSPNTTTISSEAFYNCNNLRYIKIPSTVTTYSSSAFSYCYRLFEVEELSPYVTVNKGGSGAGEFALAVYTSDTATKMEKTTVNGYNFAKSSSVWYLTDLPEEKDFTLPSSVNGSKYIIPRYFFFRTVANKLTLTSGVNSISDYAFNDTYIQNVLTNNAKFTLGNQVFANTSKLKKVDLSNLQDLTYLPERTFENNSELTEVKLPQTISQIGAYAFAYCTKLNSINMPNALSAIGNYAFDNCLAIKALTFPNNLERVGFYAFRYAGFTQVDVPNSVDYIGQGAFYGCASIKKIKLPFVGYSSNSSNSYFGYIFGASSYNYNGSYVPSALEEVEITSSNRIYDNAFYGCSNIKSIKLNGSIEDIGDYAFYNCSKLKTITMYSGLETLGDYVFYGCSSLESIALPSSVTSLGDYAFNGCSNLKTANLNASSLFDTLGTRTFYNCTSLTSVTLPTNLQYVNSYAFYNCYSLKAISIPSSVRQIGNYAFEYTGIASLTLPSSLTSIGSYAFYYCPSLATVTIPYGVSSSLSIGNYAFEGCYNLHEVYNLTGYFPSMTVGYNGYGMLAYYAVIVNRSSSDPALKTTTVNGKTFKYNSNVCALVKYTGDTSSVELGDVMLNGSTYSSYVIARNAFESYLSKLTITDSVSNIMGYAFNYGINTLIFDGSPLTIGQYAFNGYVSQLIYDSSLSGISSNAFTSNTSSCNVYYKGSSSEWASNPYITNFYSVYRPDYYYSKCIHEAGNNLWNYDSNGYVNTSATAYNYRILEDATCTTTGVGEYYCNDCGYSREVVISIKAHIYNGYVCTKCESVQDNVQVYNGNASTIKNKIITMVNDTVSPYNLFSANYYGIRSTNVNANTSSTLTMTAKVDVSISFNVRISNYGVGEVTISHGGGNQTITGTNNNYINVNLKKGESLSITFNRNNTEGSNCYVEITNIYVS